MKPCFYGNPKTIHNTLLLIWFVVILKLFKFLDPSSLDSLWSDLVEAFIFCGFSVENECMIEGDVENSNLS